MSWLSDAWESIKRVGYSIWPGLSSSQEGMANTDYGSLEYLEGLFSSAGAENETNRQFNSAQAALNRDFQSQEAQIQRDWYEAMSNSAYSRAMADMQSAGINPILAYQQGGAASSGTGLPSGSAASYNVGGGDSAADVLSSVADLVSAIKGSGRSWYNYFKDKQGSRYDE